MPMSLDVLGQTCLAPSLMLARRLQKKKLSETTVGRSALQRVLSRLFLRIGCFPFYNAGFQSCQRLISCLFPGDAETIPGVSGNEDVSNDEETDGQLRECQIVVTRSLVPLAGGPSMMSLRMSTVEIGAGSCWNRHLMMVVFVLKRGISKYCSIMAANFYHISCVLDRFVTDPAATLIRAIGISDGVLVSIRL